MHALLEEIGVASRKVQTTLSLNHILIGVDAETDEEVFWNPRPHMAAVNWVAGPWHIGVGLLSAAVAGGGVGVDGTWGSEAGTVDRGG